MFVFEVNSVEANRTIFNEIEIDSGEVIDLKMLPKCIGFESWDQYAEIRLTRMEIDFGVIVPVVFAVDDGEVADARVLIVEAL